MSLGKILYVSTNSMWSGSEELWSRSAKGMLKLGYSVSFAVKYNHPEVDNIEAIHINFSVRYPAKEKFKRIIEKINLFKFNNKDVLKDFILEVKPRIIIISQGNNYESIDIMQFCKSVSIPYITLTQLVAEIFVGAFDNERLAIAQQAYLGSLKNYFVSDNNLRLNNFLLGVDLSNAEVIYNPCKLVGKKVAPFPVDRHSYTIALVGRIDCWHKGYDLFIQVISQQKWKERPIHFNMYGEGPNKEFLNQHIVNSGLKNVTLRGHSSQITDVWRDNQMLLLPSRIEGQALALIEAMWCQRAAIVTDVGGATELIEEGYNGFIASVASAASIDAALEKAWEQRNQWEYMGLNAAQALSDKYPADAVEYFNNKIFKLINPAAL